MHHMKDPRLAEAYCDRMYDAEAAKNNGKRGRRQSSWSAPMRQPSYDMYLSLIQARPLTMNATARECRWVVLCPFSGLSLIKFLGHSHAKPWRNTYLSLIQAHPLKDAVLLKNMW